MASWRPGLKPSTSIGKLKLFTSKMAGNSNSKPVYIPRIHTLIKRTTLGHKKKLENSPHLIIPSPIILDMIYGTSNDDLEKFLHTEQEKEAQWYLDQPAQVKIAKS